MSDEGETVTMFSDYQIDWSKFYEYDKIVLERIKDTDPNFHDAMMNGDERDKLEGSVMIGGYIVNAYFNSVPALQCANRIMGLLDLKERDRS